MPANCQQIKKAAHLLAQVNGRGRTTRERFLPFIVSDKGGLYNGKLQEVQEGDPGRGAVLPMVRSCPKEKPKKKMYQRPDGLFEQSKIIDGKRVVFRGKTEKEVTDKMVAYTAQQEAGPAFREVAEDWREEAYREIEYNTAKGYEAKYKHALEYFESRRPDCPSASVSA